MPARRRSFRTAAGATALAVALACGGMATLASGASSTTTVSATVPSATSLSTGGCPTGSATQLGIVLPGSSTVTSADCSVTFGSSNDSSMLRIHQADREGFAMFRPASSVALHAPFDTDGRQTVKTGTSSSAHDIVRLVDGSIVLVGSAAMTSTDFLVTKLTPAGALDTSFDADGHVTIDFVGETDVAYGVAVQPDGKLVVVGQGMTGSQIGGAIARLHPDGSLDTGFDGDGKRLLDASTYQMREFFELALQPDGKIVGVGYGGNTFAIVRFNADGSLDTSFDTDGRVFPSIGGGTSYARSVIVEDDGRIVVGGDSYIDTANNYDFAIMRLNANGSMDTTFDVDGKTTTFLSTSTERGHELMRTAAGKYVLAGSAGFSDTGLARYNADGTLDTSFGSSGTTILTAAGAGMGALQQLDGKIVVVGTQGGDFEVSRFDADGTVDGSFDGDGIGTTPVGDGHDEARSVVAAADGRLLVAGHATVATVAHAGVVQLGGTTTINDFASPTYDWVNGTDVFGACLHGLSNATASWPLAGAGNCSTALDANWRGVVASQGSAGAKVASAATGATNASAAFRFGLRTASSQPPGMYTAVVAFEVVAPNA